MALRSEIASLHHRAEIAEASLANTQLLFRELTESYAKLMDRLAEVEALCEGWNSEPSSYYAAKVLAALRGEDNRPAEHRCTTESMRDPESDCWSDPSE